MGETVLTKDQLRNLILAEKIRPSDLFPVDALIEDEAVKGHVALQVKDVEGAKSGEYYHRKRTEEAFDKARKEFDDKLKAKDEELNSLKIAAAKSNVTSLFDKQKADRKLDDRQMKFIQNRLARFAPQKPDEVEKEFNTFLDGEIDEYKRLAKDVFGIEDKPEGGDGKDKKAGAEPGGQGGGEKKPNPIFDPAKNEFLKIDKIG